MCCFLGFFITVFFQISLNDRNRYINVYKFETDR